MKTFLVSVSVTALMQLANIASGVLAARLLLPEGRGALAIAILWPSLFAAVGFLSSDQGITYYAASRRESTASVLTTGLCLAFALSIITITVGYIGLPFLVGDIEGDALSDT